MIKLKEEFKGLFSMTNVMIEDIVPADPTKVRELQMYWMKQYGVDIGEPTKIVKIKFNNTPRMVYDYPSTLFDIEEGNVENICPCCGRGEKE